MNIQTDAISRQINYIKKLEEITSNFTLDLHKNIEIIVRYTHEILGGTCSLYNKLDKRDQSLISWAKENTPPDLPEKDNALGHICYEATIKGKDKVIVISDISQTPYYESDPYVKRYGLRSYLGFPVKIENQSIGSLCIVDTEPRVFTDLEISIIGHLANIIKIQEENLKIGRIQAVLHNISHTLLSRSNLDEICLQIKSNLNTLFESSNFAIALFEQEGSSTTFQYFENNQNDNCCEEYLIKELRQKNTTLVLSKKEIQKLIPEKTNIKNLCHSWIGIPLKIDNKMIGAISLKSFNQRIFLQEDIDLLEFVSYEIAHILNEKKLREKLKKKEEEYRSIVNQSSIGIYRTDFFGNILFVNDAMVKMLDYDSAEELLNLDLQKTYHPDYEREYFLQFLQENKTVTNKETIWTTKNGKKIYIRETARLLNINNSNIIEGTVEDITEEVMARNAYKFEKERFANLTTSVPVGILQINDKDKIIFSNDQFEKITGYGKKDIKTVNQFYDKVSDIKKNSGKDISHNSTIKILRDKNGLQKYVKIIKTNIAEGAYFITIEDITESIISKTELIEESKYLAAINKISNKLLSNNLLPYDDILKIIGETLNVSEINFNKVQVSSDDLEINIIARWVSPFSLNIHKEKSQKQIYSLDEFFPNWKKRLTETDYFFGTVDDFLYPEKKLMESQEIMSLFVHSIQVNDENYRFLVLKNYSEKRQWTDRDVMFIQTIINNLKEAIDQKLMNTKLNNSKTSYMELFKNSSSGIVIFNRNCQIENINPTAEIIFNRKYDDIIGKPVNYLVDDTEIIDNIDNSIKFCNTVNSSKKMDIIIGYADNIKALDLSFKKILYFDKSSVIMYAHDITLRYKKEYEIRKNLNEKQTLLQEIHHRVKNNLQIISSLLNLQMKDIETEKDRSLFMDSQNRIKSIALIHESLYNSRNLSKINFREYTEKLIKRLLTVFHIDSTRITYHLDIPDSEFNIKKAIPCGLILDELITNSLKYAFPENREGNIAVHFLKNKDHYHLIVKDNGIGFDSKNILKNKTTLGFELITTLVQQLKGHFSIIDDKGFGIKIVFPD